MTIICNTCFTENPDTNTTCYSCGEPLIAGTANYHLQPGTILTSQHNQYRIEKTLGSGGFGITYKAIEQRNNTIVAIKENWPEGATRHNCSVNVPTSISPQNYQEQLNKVLQEAQNIHKCKHPNVVNVYDWFIANNTAYIVMEFIPGQSLYDLLLQQGPLSAIQVTKYLISICEALKTIHSNGLLHRDIKPENILVDNQDRAVLIDFGNAREFIADKTHRMSVILSHSYAPIEQYGQMQRRDQRLDIYALCATMYELVTGQQPPSAPDRLQNDPLIPPNQCPNISINPILENAILKGMKMAISERFETVDQLIESLKGTPPDVIKARELVQQGQLQQAVQLYKQCVTQFKHPDTAVELAMVVVYLDDNEAEKASQEAISLNPNDGRGYGILGLVYCRQRKWQEAVNQLEKAVNLAPSQAWIYGNLAWALGKIGNWSKAETTVKNALQLESESPFLLGLSAWIYANLSQYTLAIRYAKPALFKIRNLPHKQIFQQWIYPCLACCLIHDPISQNSAEFSNCLNNFLSQLPQNAWALGLKGWYELKQGLQPQANSSFAQAITSGNIPNWLVINQAFLLEKMGKTAEAINLYQRCLQTSSNSDLIYFRLGTLSGKNQDWAKAKDYLEKAIKLTPNFAEAYHNLGWVLLNIRDASGNLNHAREFILNYRKAVTLYQQQGKLNIEQDIRRQFQLLNFTL